MTFRPNHHPEELISASLSGDLSAAERSTLDAHLAGCERCRATLHDFGEERRLVGELRRAAPPRDLGARVRAGIESAGQVPWWRRPSAWVGAIASLAVAAAALLAVVVLTDLAPGPIGSSGSPAASASTGPIMVPSGSPESSPEATTSPSPQPAPGFALGPGQLGYLALAGEPFSPLNLSFIADASGDSVKAEAPSGPPISAAVSPTGEWLAYITRVGESGANQVWLLHLADGSSRGLGCSLPNPFTERLAWSDDGRFLAYTLSEIDLGGSVDCGGAQGDGSATNAWLFDAAATGAHFRVTDAGNAFAADFASSLGKGGAYRLLVSYGAEEPYTEELMIGGSPGTGSAARLDGAFMPLLSPDGKNQLFWRGQMARDPAGAWRFVRGGMPHVGPAGGSDGEQLFVDLVVPGGAGFESGHVAWSADGDAFAVWGAAWTGAPQDAEGVYPSERAAYVGRLSGGLLSIDSALALPIGEMERIVSVALDPTGQVAVVTVARAQSGVGDPPSAALYRVPVAGSEAEAIGGQAGDSAWNGPAVFGSEPIALVE